MGYLRRDKVQERPPARCCLDSTPNGCPAGASVVERGELGLDVAGNCAAVRKGLGRREEEPAAQRATR
jgi:hypothetical protein